MSELYSDDQISISSTAVTSNKETIEKRNITAAQITNNLRWWQLAGPAVVGLFAIGIMIFTSGNKAGAGALLGLLSAAAFYLLQARSEKYIDVVDKPGKRYRIYQSRDQGKINKIRKLLRQYPLRG